MGRAGIRIVLLALVGAGAYAVQSGLVSVGVHTSVCRQDDELDKALREEASKAALGFVDVRLKPDTAQAYQRLTPELKSAHSADVFAETAKKIQASGPFSGAKVDQIYEPSVGGRGSARVLCGSLSGGRWVSVEAKPGVTQVHAIVTAQTQNNDWAFTLWLIKNGSDWQVHGYYLSMASIAGHFPAELLDEARVQEKMGHTLNAHMLYVAIGGLIDRGPSFQLGLKQDVDADLLTHKTPPELSGKLPFAWRLDGKDYSVEKVEILGIGKQLVLTLMRRDSEWDGKDKADAERRNKVFIEAFIKAHPEYAETFGALVARVLPANGESGWGTVYDAKTGYK